MLCTGVLFIETSHMQYLQRISIVVPALNEASNILRTLLPLQQLRSDGHQIIVVDGGSSDSTVSIAAPLADIVFTSDRGRAVQMNAGAALAANEILLFLHADTQLPSAALTDILEGLDETSKVWGRFDIRLSGNRILFRLVERMMNWRSCLTGIATGDQAIFVKRDLFEQLGRYSEIPLMEDIALCSQLKKYSRPLCLSRKVISSSRRWESAGVIRTITLMLILRLAYALGISPQRLARAYQN